MNQSTSVFDEITALAYRLNIHNVCSGGHPLEISVVFLLHCYFIKHLWFTINRGK